VIDAGACALDPTTVIDLTPMDKGDDPVVLRQGAGRLAAIAGLRG
jgi:tRNA A37 threonylcarbamoyladenosine synthetase subunit TsaC/SUA5/YrdC